MYEMYSLSGIPLAVGRIWSYQMMLNAGRPLLQVDTWMSAFGSRGCPPPLYQSLPEEP